MKPFDLAAEKAGAKLVTRDGREVKGFHHFECDNSKQLCAAYIGDNGNASWFREDGMFYASGEESSRDLFMAPKAVTKYLNVYGSSNGSYEGNNSYVFDNKSAAETNADRNEMPVLVRALPIEIEV
jgi:hypothetical protein